MGVTMKQQDSASGAVVRKKFNKPHNAAEWLELVMNVIFFLCGILAIGCVALITVYMVISGLPAIGQIGVVEFLFGQKWASTAAEPFFGILPFILSSVYGTLGAILIGIPIGLLTAVFLSKAATPKLRTAATSAIELLSGIPSVIFGLLGMQLLVPAVAAAFGRASGACLLAAAPAISPMARAPSIFVTSVSTGKVPRYGRRLTAYLSMAPTAPPSPTKTKPVICIFFNLFLQFYNAYLQCAPYHYNTPKDRDQNRFLSFISLKVYMVLLEFTLSVLCAPHVFCRTRG